MTAPRLLPAGPTALLVELGDDGEARPADLAAALRAHDPERILVDVVPAASTVLVTFAPEAGGAVHTLVRRAYDQATRTGERGRENEPLTIPVRYDGPDLELVAERSGLSAAEVTTRHSAAAYEVEFLGFAPGFAYLRGLDPALILPRLETPRTRVPAGAVAIAGPYSAVYPRPSPGGWLLLGTTDLRLFDAGAMPPARLQAGDRVRFEVVE